jgi:tRNA threonylcarbamoyladenosine modification (KEOPS) complex Cgi121 subunit
LIQKLPYNEDTYFIGLSEISNSKGLGVNQLLDLAKSYSEDLLAIQFFNSNLIASEIHLLSAAQNAINAWRGDYMIARTLDVEIIVYASAQRQIHQALSILGVKDGLSSISVVIIGADEQKVTKILNEIIANVGEEYMQLFLPTDDKIEALMKTFDITESEMQYFVESNDLMNRIKALSRCIASRVTLVAIGI